MIRRRNFSDTDDVLLGRYLAGDSRAFDLLMEAHERRVFAISLRILRDREEALDATQETFITVLRKAGGVRGQSGLLNLAVPHCRQYLLRRAT